MNEVEVIYTGEKVVVNARRNLYALLLLLPGVLDIKQPFNTLPGHYHYEITPVDGTSIVELMGNIAAIPTQIQQNELRFHFSSVEEWVRKNVPEEGDFRADAIRHLCAAHMLAAAGIS